MKIQYRLVTVLLLMVLAACVTEYVRRSRLPSLRIANPVIDLGIVHVDEIHYVDFEIENRGDRDLSVSGHSTPCPGVFEHNGPIVISKGTSERITVGLLIRDKAMDDMPQTYRYTIKTDDHAAPKMELNLVAHRKPK